MFAECTIQYDTKKGRDIYIFIEKQILVCIDPVTGDQISSMPPMLLIFCHHLRVHLAAVFVPSQYLLVEKGALSGAMCFFAWAV